MSAPLAQKKGGFWKRHRALRVCTCALAGCVLAAAVFLGVTNAVAIGTAAPHFTTVDEAADADADAIVVLGAFVHPDGTPSDILKDRLDNAVALYEAGAAPKIIMSGDHGTVTYDEVKGMKDYAISQGVPAEDVFCDHAGFSTYETMHRAKHVFGAEKIIVSTQSYHLSRALYDALGVGMDALGVPSDLHAYQQQIIWDVREAPARTKDVLMVALGAEPTFGGEPINLDGSGNVTDG